MKMTNKDLETPWGSIHFSVGGQGPALILLHGNMGSHQDFIHQLSFFAADYTLYAFDTRGHGKSPLGSRPMTIYNLAVELEYILNKLQIQECSILGFSDGGNIALQYAALYPHRLKSLVLAGVNVHPEGLRFFALQGYRLLYSFSSTLSHFIPSMEKISRILYLTAWEPEIPKSQLRKILIPSLILTGQRDAIDLNHIKAIAKAMPHAGLAIIPGAGHHILLEKPHLCNRLIEKFLKQN